jgi:hypothetical protein
VKVIKAMDIKQMCKELGIKVDDERCEQDDF